MPIPADHSNVESLADIVRKEHNRQVKAWFANTPDNDVSTPDSRLKQACLIQEDDPILVALQRQWLFEITIGRSRSLQTPVFGIPVASFTAQRKYRPQVMLYFQQNSLQVKRGEAPVTGEISYRIMDETSETITEAKALAIARRIETNFGGTSPFVWQKGNVMCTYTDWQEGLQLQILADNKNEGERVVRAVLKVHGGTFDGKKFNVNINQEASTKYSSTKKTKRILNKTVTLPLERPRANVRFRYATLALHGLTQPIALYDLTLTLINPLVQSNLKIF